MIALDLFECPIYVSTVRQWHNVKDSFLKTIDWGSEECYREEGMVGGYTDYFKFYNAGIVPNYFDKLMDIISEPMSMFQQMNPGAYVSNAWCQRYSKTACHPAHNHGALGFSAVFYAQLDSYDSPTSFFSPFPNPWTGQVKAVVPDCSEGDIIFFPSSLIHQSLPHRGYQDKIIFSFNISKSTEQISL